VEIARRARKIARRAKKIAHRAKKIARRHKNYSSRIINFPSRKINSHGGGFIQSYYLWILHRNHCIFPDFYYFCKGGSKRHLGMTFKQT
jgi:hypothetical protein